MRIAYIHRTLPATALLALACAGAPVAQAQSCPYSSVQARVQAHILDPWKQTMSVIQKQRFRVGGFYNGTGMLAPNSVTLRVTGPGGYVVNPPVNGVYVDAPYAGTYTFTVTCGTLSDSATVTATATTAGTPATRPNLYGIGVAWGPQWGASLTSSQWVPWDNANMDSIASAGGGMTHVSFDWAGIEQQNNVYTWTYVDHQVADAEARGLQMFAYTGNTPNWALNSSQQNLGYRFPPAETSAMIAEFQDFHRTLATRYCGRVRFYEFWNEPNGCSWVNPGCSNSDDASIQLYVRWLQRWYTAMKQGCDDVVLSTGGLDCHLGTDCPTYIRKVYQFGGKDYSDAVSIHPYGDTATATAINYGAVTGVTTELNTQGTGWRKLFLDEWGWNIADETLKSQLVDSVLNTLATQATYSNVYAARYLTLTDIPGGSNSWGLCSSNLATQTVTPRSSWYAFRTRAKGNVNDIPLQNGRIETNSSSQYGYINYWYPNGGWANHAEYPRPNNENLGKKFGFYSAGTTETVGQLVTTHRFQAGKTYRFMGWVHGGGDNIGVVPFQIGYASTDGNINSFVLLRTITVSVGNTWFQSSGVSWTPASGAAEVNKQIIVRFGPGAAGGQSDIWFDNLTLTVTP